VTAHYQRYTLVARAIVTDAAISGTVGEKFTVPDIVAHYGLEWGAYHKGEGAPPRADQLIRNELNRASRTGLLHRTEEKDGAWRVYMRSSTAERCGDWLA
jgi:hypothetical protein